MSEEKFDDLSWLERLVKYNGALLKYNQILTLLALDNRDDDVVTFLLDGLCKDSEFFIKKVPEAVNYLNEYCKLEVNVLNTVDYQLALHKQRLKKNPILASS